MGLRSDATAPGESKNRYEDREKFERELEARYSKPAEFSHLSILAYVDSERDELVPMFWAWKQVGRWDGPVGQLARQWEQHRFGCELYESAHQVLMFAIMESLTPEQRPSRYGRIRANQSTEQRKESLNEALEAITKARTMPHVEVEMADRLTEAAK